MEIRKWLGLKNTTSPERLKPGELEVARNVDVDNDFKVLSRKGQTIVQSGSYHSLWASDGTCLVMVGQDMKRMMPDGSLTTLIRLTTGRPVCFVELNNVVYFSNGTDTGRVVNGEVREWGIRPPLGQPAATQYAGLLRPGRYLYAMTFVRSDGLESGTGIAGMIELTTVGGILFTGLEVSTNPEVTGKILYLSTANGTEMYRAVVLPASATSTAYMNSGVDLTVALDTQFVEQAPPGEIVEIHSGVAYVISGSVAWYSDAYSVERFRRSQSRFLQFPSRISLFGSAGDGIYVGTDAGTWFLEGFEPTSFRSRQVLSYGAVMGTSVKFDVEEEVAEGEKDTGNTPALMWTTPHGIVVGNSNGVVTNVTENTYGFPDAQRGAGVIRVTRGFTQYVATLQGTGAAPNIYE